jgi:hypothetical protein
MSFALVVAGLDVQRRGVTIASRATIKNALALQAMSNRIVL